MHEGLIMVLLQIKSCLQPSFCFRKTAPGESLTLFFPVQAKRTHAESVIFEYGKQTCSGNPFSVGFCAD